MSRNRMRVLAAAAVTVAALGILGYSASTRITVAQVSGGEIGAGGVPADHARHHPSGSAYSGAPATPGPVGAMNQSMMPQMSAQMANTGMSSMMEGSSMPAHMAQMAPMMKGIDMQTHMAQMAPMMKGIDMQAHMAQMAPMMDQVPDSPKSGQ
jgi:hypothetical protein